MNILFLTLSRISDINNRGIYTDLMRKFRDEGHFVNIVCPVERRFNQDTQIIQQDGVNILRVKTLNIQKTNIFEKGVGTLLLELQYYKAIRKFHGNIKFDLILYSTPPITFTSVIRSLKKQTGAITYLLLKDIFPQNAVDIGMLNTYSPIYKYFRRKEKRLYALSDHIGCMSNANLRYLLEHNPEIPDHKVEVNPNSISISGDYLTEEEKRNIRLQYNIPSEKVVFVYGGNLGKPQGVTFLPEIIKANKINSLAFFVIVGSGTEFNGLNKWFQENNPENALLLSALPKDRYDHLVQSCDVGLILLDKRFTIPNFPSRLLSYLEYKMPVITATDPNTDIGTIAEENGFGYKALHGDIGAMNLAIRLFSEDRVVRHRMGEWGYQYLFENYLVEHSYNKIITKINVSNQSVGQNLN